MSNHGIAQKAMAAYKENRKRPGKYQIEDECWADWYAMGYKQAIEDNKSIK